MTITRRRLLGGLAGVAATGALAQGASATASHPSLIGHPVPPLQQPALDGRMVNLATMHGRVLLVTFWASWCGPCLTELPVFAQWLVQLGGRGLEVVGISMDDGPEPIRTVVSRLHLNFPVLRGNAAIARQFGGVLGLPVSFLVDRKGTVRQRLDGAVDLNSLHHDVLTLLG